MFQHLQSSQYSVQDQSKDTKNEDIIRNGVDAHNPARERHLEDSEEDSYVGHRVQRHHVEFPVC